MIATAINKDLLLAAIEAMPGDELATTRRAAAIRFAELGFPTIGEEDWKYTSLSRAAEISNEWLNAYVANGEPQNQSTAGDLVAAIQDKIDAHWIILRDGYVDAGLPDIDGIHFSRLAGGTECLLAAADAMSTFNAALLRDGLRITAEPNANPARPIGILTIDSPANAMAQSRVIVDAGENSHLRIVECCLSAEAGRQFTNSIFEVELASGARLDHVRIQNRDAEHVGVNRINTRLDRDARFNHNSFDLGGALTRNDVIADIAGKGASVSLNGLYLATGDQHIDNHTSIIHGVGPSTSEEEYRGILSGKAQCVFNGKVIVSPGADGTDSRQSNHNLLLSDRAEIDTKPELEIYADDVKCAHGATIGQLDETALFYLRSRGLGLDEARRVITRAFAAGTLSTLAVTECHDYLADLLDLCLAELVDEKP
jgi:Fe-S cluster assembly protein SufD